MARTARFDIPGFLYHVYIRGIQRGSIFITERDREEFAERFSRLLVETGTNCLAWSFLTNHAHFLLRTMEGRLCGLMRRLLTGYAVWFNKKHRRSGHLFQNRFGSRVCQEEPYLLELVRYIHLNPVWAQMVTSLEALAEYPWTGHPVILGQREFPGQDTKAVLSLFGGRASARERYLGFLAAGLGKPSEKAPISGLTLPNGDSGILGDEEFKRTVRVVSDIVPPWERPSLGEIINIAAGRVGIDPTSVLGRRRSGRAPDARALAAYLAVKVFGYNGAETGRALGMCRSAVSARLAEGEQIDRATPAQGAMSGKGHQTPIKSKAVPC